MKQTKDPPPVPSFPDTKKINKDEWGVINKVDERKMVQYISRIVTSQSGGCNTEKRCKYDIHILNDAAYVSKVVKY